MRHLQEKMRLDGAALVIGLVLLTVISMLAVSGMLTSMTELAIARSNQSSESAFQAAEAGLALALNQPTFPTTSPLTIEKRLNANDRVSVTVEFERETDVTDRAFSLGMGSGGVSAFHFIARSEANAERAGTGTVTDRYASARHSQAFYVIGPQGTGPGPGEP